mmetsp:Transcript_103207/g.291435  ORF Transcript_103207/g.291435 Transcript_103207/m.291435 type:complete len:92 (-) Transcript_103207:100-375(-)|eukprot:CAMPEP_0117465884 /NCGR_PEP_ID=MMETSP0784-20121206/4855_1 /TAXON_ID=39447 /ORGANISM="" /LENGTH=91 /DNA_ID=CAMNT_0005259805 /DNA_START=62 /DNA_END=337 /DNA_ORIENTATION=-
MPPGRNPTGWCNMLRSKRVNIWDIKRYRPLEYMCIQPYHEVKFNRPPWLNRWGNPKKPRNPDVDTKGQTRRCDMTKLHKQDQQSPFIKQQK